MSLQPAVLYSGGLLTTSPTTLVTAGVNAKTLLTKAVFTNTDVSARLLTVYIVRAGASALAANTLIYPRSLAAGEAYEASEIEGQILSAGDMIQAKADAAGVVNCTGISGYVQS